MIEEQNVKLNNTGGEKRENVKREIRESHESENEACVFAMLSEECDKELEKKEAKLKEQTKRKHERESTRMEKRIHEEILKIKKEKKVVSHSSSRLFYKAN